MSSKRKVHYSISALSVFVGVQKNKQKRFYEKMLENLPDELMIYINSFLSQRQCMILTISSKSFQMIRYGVLKWDLSRTNSLKFILDSKFQELVTGCLNSVRQQLSLNVKIPIQFFCFTNVRWSCHTVSITTPHALSMPPSNYDAFLRNFEQLSILKLSDFPFSLSDLTFPFHQLQEISLFHCSQMTNLDLQALAELRSVRITGCELISDVSPLSKCEKLLLGSLLLLSDISCLKQVKCLTLFNCPLITSVEGLDNIQEINLLTCYEIKDISCLQHAVKISVTDSYKIEKFPIQLLPGANRLSFSLFRPHNGTNLQLDPFANVQLLDFIYCDNLAFFCSKDFHCVKLRRCLHPFILIMGGRIQKLILESCHQAHVTNASAKIKNFIAQKNDDLRLVCLAEATIENAQLQSMDGVDFLFETGTSIGRIAVWNCLKLKNLESLQQAQVLHLKNCDTIRKLPKRLSTIPSIILENCSQLSNISEIDFSNTSVQIINCPKIKMKSNTRAGRNLEESKEESKENIQICSLRRSVRKKQPNL